MQMFYICKLNLHKRVHFIDSGALLLFEYFSCASVIVVLSLSLSLSLLGVRESHTAANENTSGTSPNICLHFSDLPLSARGLSLFHVSPSFPLFFFFNGTHFAYIPSNYKKTFSIQFLTFCHKSCFFFPNKWKKSDSFQETFILSPPHEMSLEIYLLVFCFR